MSAWRSEVLCRSLLEHYLDTKPFGQLLALEIHILYHCLAQLFSVFAREPASYRLTISFSRVSPSDGLPLILRYPSSSRDTQRAASADP